MPSFVDLHTHTTVSDGGLTPAQLVRLAEERALSAVAITDHDSVAGVEEAQAAADGLDIEVISGIEMSADFEGEMHILGLFVDPYAAILQGAMHDMGMWRAERNEHMLSRLADLGMENCREAVLKMTDGRMDRVGRMHMALALAESGAVASTGEAFKRYLVSTGEAYVPRKRFSPQKCIEIIKASGGYAFLAHPCYSQKSSDKLASLVEELMSYGLDGIECYHSSQPHDYSEQCLKLCKQYDLMVSGGSDFHGENRPGVQLGCAFDGRYIDFDILQNIKDKIGIMA